MNYKCIACNELGFKHFYNKEKALIYLLNLNNEQKDIFIYSLKDDELITKMIMNYKDTYLEIENNSIYYKDHYLNIYSYYIETNHIECNLLFEYLKRFHKIWCCIDDENNIIWINACKVLKNCVK